MMMWNCIRRLRHRTHALALLLAAVLFAGIGYAASSRAFPGATWQAVEPAAVGLDGARLDALAQALGGRGCVVRYGYMAHGWGDVAQRADVGSAGRPIFSHFLLVAVEERKIAGLDEHIMQWEPRLFRLNEEIFFKERNITWEHLARQTGGYGVRDLPTAFFSNNEYQVTLLADTLFNKVYGASWPAVDAQVFYPKLAQPLQCQDRPSLAAVAGGPGRLAISPRDFARFGLLYMNEGYWNGRSLLGADLARMAVSEPVSGIVRPSQGRQAAMISGQRTLGCATAAESRDTQFSGYSWLWCVNGIDATGRLRWPDAPADTFGAFGYDGRHALVVIPSLKVVASWSDANIASVQAQNAAIKMLRQAVVSAGTGPAPITTLASISASPAPARSIHAPAVTADLVPAHQKRTRFSLARLFQIEPEAASPTVAPASRPIAAAPQPPRAVATTPQAARVAAPAAQSVARPTAAPALRSTVGPASRPVATAAPAARPTATPAARATPTPAPRPAALAPPAPTPAPSAVIEERTQPPASGGISKMVLQ